MASLRDRPLAVLDVETSPMRDGERPRTLFWGIAFEGEEYRRFKSTRALWRFLLQRSKREGFVVYHHHDYDPLIALADGAPLRPRLTSHGRIISSVGPAGVEWRNSYAIFPSALAEILEACGFVKPSLDDLKQRNRADTVDTLVALRRIATSYEEAFGLYPLDYVTQAGCALAAAERVAGKLPLDLRRREAYRGGRVELFRPGVEIRAEVWDRNSCYPSAFLDAPSRDTLLEVEAEVATDGPCPFWSRAAIEDKRRPRLLFPRGKVRTSFYASNYERFYGAFPGVRRLRVDRSRSLKVDLSWLQRAGSLFSRAYEARLRAKRDGNAPLAYAIKIGCNSCYGRLGLKAEREIVEVREDAAPSCEEVQWTELGFGRNIVFRDVRTRPSANYPFAAYVTDNARARLYAGLRSCEDPLYCDTDSIFVREGSRHGLGPSSSALGAWALKERGPFTGRTVKDYVLNGEHVFKGGDHALVWSLKGLLARGTVREQARKPRCKRCRKHAVACVCVEGPLYDDKRLARGIGQTVPITAAEWD